MGKSPKPTKLPEIQSQLTFGQAMEAVKLNRKITKLEWNNPNEYGLMKDGWLMICRSGKFHKWEVNDGDLLGEDWILIPEGN